MADQMADEGILVRNVPPKAERRAGRRPTVAYALDDGEKAALESHLEDASPPGTLRKGQQLVFASVEGPQLLDVMEVLAQRGAESAIGWTASLDGRRQERMVIFDGDDALGHAEDLMAALTALKVDCYRGALTEVAGGRQSIAAAKRATETAAEAAKEQAGRQASW